MQLDISRNAAAGVAELLDQHEIEYENRTIRPRPGQILASGTEILSIIGDATPYGALAAIVITWLKANSRRRVTITTTDYKVVHEFEGMSPDDIAKVLESARRVTMIDPSKPDKAE
jgi:hypothetical protein